MSTPTTSSEQPLAIFLQRFRLALADLGLPVPADWITSEDGTAVAFGDLTPRQADRLAHALEELLARLPELSPVRHSELDQTLPVEFGIAVPSLDLAEVL